MRRTLFAVLFLVLVINYVDRASCQATNATNTTNTGTANSTNNSTANSATNSTGNSTANSTGSSNSTGNSTANSTGTNNATNNTSGANTNANTSTGTTPINNITFFKANGSALTAVNTYNSLSVKAGKSLYVYFQLTAASQPKATVYVLPTDVSSVYTSYFPLKLSVILQPTTATTASLVTTSQFDGNALTGTATLSADSFLMAQIDNPDTTRDYQVLVNFLTNNISLLSPMGTASKSRNGVTLSALQGAWDIYEMYVPSTNVKVLMRLFSCMGASQLFYATTLAEAQNIAKTATLQAADVIPNNSLEVSYSAVSTVYVVVNPYSGSTQADGTLSSSYALDASMYNSTTSIPYSSYVAGGSGLISYTRSGDSNAQFSWSPVVSASSDYTGSVTYNIFVATSQDNFTALMNCAPVGTASANSASSFSYNSSTNSYTVPLNPATNYYVGVVGIVSNYALTSYQNNIPALYVPYQVTAYNYVKPSSSESNPAGLGVTVFFLVLLIIIVIILAIVLYTKYKARKNGELGGASMQNRAAATTTATAAVKTSVAKASSPPQSAMPVLPKKETEPPKKPETKYAPAPVPEATPSIRVDKLKDDHGLQQVDHHYEVEQNVPDNYDYQPGNEYQGEEYNAGAQQDDYNPDAYANQEEQGQEYELPQDQHEVSPDNDHHGHHH